jgi:hypothetical protein
MEIKRTPSEESPHSHSAIRTGTLEQAICRVNRAIRMCAGPIANFRPRMLDDLHHMSRDGQRPDDDRLLPGETSSLPSAEEAIHWVTVYSELAEFVRNEVGPFAPALAERYERRLTFWLRRLEELTT